MPRTVLHARGCCKCCGEMDASSLALRHLDLNARARSLCCWAVGQKHVTQRHHNCGADDYAKEANASAAISVSHRTISELIAKATLQVQVPLAYLVRGPLPPKSLTKRTATATRQIQMEVVAVSFIGFGPKDRSECPTGTSVQAPQKLTFSSHYR